jgi:acyl-CoA thioester hydrolase
METRKSEVHPPETRGLFERFLEDVREKTFQERVSYFRKQNKLA